MPNRILHESIKYCPKMEQLNWFEEVVYHRLTVSVDDYGCLDGRIVLLKNTLFPTREDISKDDIARAIEHMVALGLLRAYEAGGMPYLHFPAWEEEQRVRNKRRKFPAPPDAARDEEEPLAAEDSLSAADGGEFFAGEKHLTASCCQLTAGCPPESNPYPYPYPYPDSNPKFESGSVTNPYPIQAPGACAEERPRAGEQSLRHSLRCDTSLYSREAIDGAIPEDGVRPLAEESPRPASALPSEGAREAPREDGQSLRHSLRCDTVPQFSMGASLRSQSSLERLPASLGLLRPASATGGGLRAPLFAKREAIDGAIPEDGVRPLAGESPRPASALPSEGAQEAPREDGQSLHRGCAAPKGSPWHQGELSAKLTEGFFDPSVTAYAVPPPDPSVTAYAVPPFLSSAWSPLCAHGTRLRCSLLHWAYFALFRPQGARFVRPFSLREKGGFWTAQLPAIVPLPKRLPCVRGTKEAAQPVAAIAADESSEARRAASELANDAD